MDYDGHECIYEKSYLDRSLEMVVLGNYSDEFTLLGLGMQISLGLTGLDAAGDIRDLTADFTVNFDPKSPEWWKIAAIDTIAIFPLIGIVKYADELGAGMKALMKKAATCLQEGRRQQR